MLKVLCFIFMVSIFNISKGNASTTCTIKTSKKILLINQNINNTKYYKRTTCSYSVIKKWVNILHHTMGNISQKIINRHLLKDKIKIKMIPRTIRVIKLNHLITAQINLENIVLKNVKFTTKIKKLYFKSETTITAECLLCKQLGQKNFKIQIENSIASFQKNMWGYLNIYTKRIAFLAKKDILPSDKLKKSFFYKKIITTQVPKTIFSNLKDIKYFSLNRVLAKDSVLKNNFFYKKPVIRAYSPVKLILKKGSINLSTMARAMESGVVGQFIKVKNLNNKKIILGKVVDFNKVEIIL